MTDEFSLIDPHWSIALYQELKQVKERGEDYIYQLNIINNYFEEVVRISYKKAIDAVDRAGGDNDDYHIKAILDLMEKKDTA